MSFKEISAKEIDKNLISLISDEWALVCAGNKDKFNMMTASWGFFGEMWGKDSVIAAIRPQRYTYEFIEKEQYFTLSFLGDNKAPHKICGSQSGRDIDKVKQTGLTPVFSDNAVYFDEAELVVICQKAYADTVKEQNFLDNEPFKKWYNGDTHKLYISEIVKVLKKEK